MASALAWGAIQLSCWKSYPVKIVLANCRTRTGNIHCGYLTNEWWINLNERMRLTGEFPLACAQEQSRKQAAAESSKCKPVLHSLWGLTLLLHSWHLTQMLRDPARREATNDSDLCWKVKKPREPRPGNEEGFCARWVPSGAGRGGPGEGGGKGRKGRKSGKERRRSGGEAAQERGEAAWWRGGRMGLGRGAGVLGGPGISRSTWQMTAMQRQAMERKEGHIGAPHSTGPVPDPPQAHRCEGKWGRSTCWGREEPIKVKKASKLDWRGRARKVTAAGKSTQLCKAYGLRHLCLWPVGEASGFQTPMQPLPGYCHRNWPFGGYSVTYLSGIILKHQASQLRLGKVPEQLNLLFWWSPVWQKNRPPLVVCTEW